MKTTNTKKGKIVNVAKFRDVLNQQKVKALCAIYALISAIWVTTHTGKLEGIQSISTLSICNPYCISRMLNGNSVCAHCYTEGHTYKKPLMAHLITNFKKLTERIIPDSELPIITSIYGRIESFGDVYNVTQAINYIHIIRKNPHVKFAIWSKNVGIWAKAFQIEGKPENTTFVQSSCRLNVPAKVNPAHAWFVDYVFTVYDFEHAVSENVKIHCGFNKCMLCGHCYNKGNVMYVNEILKSDAKKYQEYMAA